MNCPKLCEAMGVMYQERLPPCECMVKIDRITDKLRRWYCGKEKRIRWFDNDKKEELSDIDISELRLEWT